MAGQSNSQYSQGNYWSNVANNPTANLIRGGTTLLDGLTSTAAGRNTTLASPASIPSGKNVSTPVSPIAPIQEVGTNKVVNNNQFSPIGNDNGLLSQGLNWLTGGIGGTNYANDVRSSKGFNFNNNQDMYNLGIATQIDNMNAGSSPLDIGMGLLNAYNVFNTIGLQNDYMDMAKEQLGMAREQWNMTKDEVSRIAQVRNNLNSGYQSGNYGASPVSKTYA